MFMDKALSKFQNLFKIRIHYFLDPDSQRIQTNLAVFKEKLRQSIAEKRLVDRYNVKGKPKKTKKTRKYPKFYYTPEEDHYQRYLLEKTVAKKLCRGETQPIVSFSLTCLIFFFIFNINTYKNKIT